MSHRDTDQPRVDRDLRDQLVRENGLTPDYINDAERHRQAGSMTQKDGSPEASEGPYWSEELLAVLVVGLGDETQGSVFSWGVPGNPRRRESLPRPHIGIRAQPPGLGTAPRPPSGVGRFVPFSGQSDPPSLSV